MKRRAFKAIFVTDSGTLNKYKNTVPKVVIPPEDSRIGTRKVFIPNESKKAPSIIYSTSLNMLFIIKPPPLYYDF
jgi:hypothetical protein